MRYGKEYDILFIEGQGSLFHPGSTATLPLMRGTQPTHLIMVHRAGQNHIRNHPEIRIPSLPDAINVCETTCCAGGTFLVAKVVGVALNTHHLNQDEAERAVEAISQETKLPCTDVIRFGAEPLLNAILQTPVPEVA
jgi:uncharacterized NAD-dependent epimerase/dehydratase family protein